ncbi:MAG: glycosyltransferase [Candidatus Lokiarchaeota archaeon]|nr:glycosyltransferase [Candidatus Lokiarchaeota archaeon]MBD3340567.1 glycosyltransferase [Candidatus Lokiarchaeota archaeon]
MKKMNICLITPGVPPDFQDGASKFFKGIFKYLKKRGHRVLLLTGKWNYELEDPSIKQLNFFKQRFLWFPQFVLKVIKELGRRDFDIVHGNGPKGAFPIVFSKYNRFISTIHDLGPFETRFTLIPIEKYIIKFIARRSHIITTCSNTIRKQLKHYIPDINVHQIFNLYSAIEEKFKPYPVEARKLKKKLRIEGPTIIYIGRIAHYKGVEDIIEAYNLAKKKISNLNLVIGGKPDFSMEKIYHQWKTEYKDIHFIGHIDDEKIPVYYTMGDVFVTYSSASEGFGLTPIEAIACGTPVICSSLRAYKEILGDNAIYVVPNNPRLLSETIISLINNEDKRNKLISKAQEYIKRYTWNEVGKKLEKVYALFLKNRY